MTILVESPGTVSTIRQGLPGGAVPELSPMPSRYRRAPGVPPVHITTYPKRRRRSPVTDPNFHAGASCISEVTYADFLRKPPPRIDPTLASRAGAPGQFAATATA